MVSDLLIARLEKRIVELEGKFTHLHIRSELTMYIISAMISAGVVRRDGVQELIENADLTNFGNKNISEAERKIMLTLINKVKISE
ncbi:RNase P/RNase MRP subunit POP5 [Erwinia persicina]|uniref:hypothetical protein n=1 Tax=Erwinia persicina TaxID=55211 RepID=UPI0020A2255F|nr:hypothetical protein [Erwinia persicina]MCP1436584.1 RNase P/RNase MRP subunit POP5 [Erwinia persicina]